MKRILVAVAFAIAVFSSTWAGEIFGKVVVDGTPAADGTAVEIKCGEKSFPATKTGKGGAYHFAVDATGKCVVTVKVKDQAASLEIASYDEPVQVDIVLETKDGKVTARRK
jgi:hypothetical protein